MTDLRAWLDARTPAAPAALSLDPGIGTDPSAASLAAEGLRALDRALRGAGERRGAFDLLAADALLTYACEAAVESADPERQLLDLVRRVGRGE